MKLPSASSAPHVSLMPVDEPVVVVSAKEEKKPNWTDTGARSLVSIDRKAPTLQVVPTLLVWKILPISPMHAIP